MTWIHMVILFLSVITVSTGVENSEKSQTDDDKNTIVSTESPTNQTEIETNTETPDAKHLQDAMQTILDSNVTIAIPIEKKIDVNTEINNLENKNMTLEEFVENMEKLSSDIYKQLKESMWSYMKDINNDNKKELMLHSLEQDDILKLRFWDILKTKYSVNIMTPNADYQLKRKLKIVKIRSSNVQMPKSDAKRRIETMQKLWSDIKICPYNNSTCIESEPHYQLSGIMNIFKTSNKSEELSYYWKTYRDLTGKIIRPHYVDHVTMMNELAVSQNFTDAGEVMRFAFEDETFVQTVDRIWTEIKPIYSHLHDFVSRKLMKYYKSDFKNGSLIPAHILGNIWAQEWQTIYPMLEPYPDSRRPKINADNINAKDIFNTVNEFYESLGFDSIEKTYQDVTDSTPVTKCLPDSLDMGDGINYKIEWCGQALADVSVSLTNAAKLLGRIQYYKQYSSLPFLYREAPTPAFMDAITDIVAVHITAPDYMNNLKFVEAATGHESKINRLFWLALEKFPLMGYAYILEKWRWDVFSNKVVEENWNQHWWDLRVKETRIVAPVARNESDLDPASKYYVAAHLPYISHLISHVLEFQIMLAMCKAANHTGPMHECYIHGVKEAGEILRNGMSLGASVGWRDVLKAMTGETEISTEGILQYFAELEKYFQDAPNPLEEEDMNESAPIIVGGIVVLLTISIIFIYCARKHGLIDKMLLTCGFNRNGSLDIATRETPGKKDGENERVRDEKV